MNRTIYRRFQTLKAFILATVLLLMLFHATGAAALVVPKLQGRVNDYAGLLSPQVRQALETRLAEFERTDSTQVVVLTVHSLEGVTIEDFSIQVARAWKIGQAGKDNGVLFTVASDDRKMRIEVGKGLEGPLTDLLAGRILDGVVKPRFKAGDFNGGISAGVEAIISATRGEFKAEPKKAGLLERYREIHGFYVILVSVIVAYFVSTVLGRLNKTIWQILSWPVIFITAMTLHSGWDGLLGSVLLLICAVTLLMTAFSSSSSSSYSSGSWSSDGGSDSSDSSDSGSFSSDSDFGGGGGDFGGGGASSDW